MGGNTSFLQNLANANHNNLNHNNAKSRDSGDTHTLQLPQGLDQNSSRDKFVSSNEL